MSGQLGEQPGCKKGATLKQRVFLSAFGGFSWVFILFILEGGFVLVEGFGVEGWMLLGVLDSLLGVDDVCLGIEMGRAPFHCCSK